MSLADSRGFFKVCLGLLSGICRAQYFSEHVRDLNLGLANIQISADHGDAMTKLLEAFLHLHLAPRFEGVC